ncbi:uncharacterized protein VTP21DRAFT_8130 [Calcarisporiella thermophila]|uniref:uncharacterized protein n=1 Tax=Calcarisporiella thermophila TaxID=911321 RepID=UPI0037430431
MKAVTYSKLLELQNIDWTLPDVIIVQNLAGLAAYLLNERIETIQYCGENSLLKIKLPFANFNFWEDWCALWRQFIKSDAPTGRLETDLMRQLHVKALNEFVKVTAARQREFHKAANIPASASSQKEGRNLVFEE